MSTLLCAETNAVVKLDLGDKGGTRRIVFSRLWDPEISLTSFGRLNRIALKHSTLMNPDIHITIITYTDVDGDTITISTHRELTEAFEQFVTHPSYKDVTPIVLRVQASFVKKRRGGNNRAMLKKIKAAQVTGDDSQLGMDAENSIRADKGGVCRASKIALRKERRRDAKRKIEVEKEEAERKKQKEKEEKVGAKVSEVKGIRGQGEGDYESDETFEYVEDHLDTDCSIEGEVTCTMNDD